LQFGRTVRHLSTILLLFVAGCNTVPPRSVEQPEPAAPPQQPTAETEYYDVHFSAVFSDQRPIARATVQLTQSSRIVRRLNFRAPSGTFTLVKNDGDAVHEGDRLVWKPPATGGTLVYDYQIDQRRSDGYDAKATSTWALLRLGDLFPAATARTRRGAQSRSTLDLSGPDGWSFETRYGPVRGKVLSVDDSERNFKRPTGWLVGGKIGTRRDFVNGRHIAVSAPVGSGIRRLDTLSFLSWTVPELARAFPSLPRHILIAGAPDEMWRGGLSAPSSLYMHAGRPLISENGTSTLLHELIHLAGMHSAHDGADWIVEGVAEYYSLLVLKRSGGITQDRFDNALARLQLWVDSGNGKLADPSKGVDTAAAVLVLHDLAAELQAQGAHIDQLTARLLEAPRISNEAMLQAAQTLLGRPSKVLATALDGT